MNSRLKYKYIFLALFCILLQNNGFSHHRDSVTVRGIELVQNLGQWESAILFKASLHGGAVFAERDGFTFAILHPEQLKAFYAGKFAPDHASSGIIDAAAYKIHFVNCNASAIVEGHAPTQGYHNYFVGNDPSKWATKVPKYQEITYQDLYPGIDLLLTQEDEHLKYEFTLAPGASPNAIQLDYEGVQNLFVSKGNLIIATSVAQLVELQPIAYQLDKSGRRQLVDCRYKVSRRTLTFEVGAYDTLRPLVIDPVLIFASYSGSTADNWGYTATYDRDGNLYSGGNVFGVGYPTSLGAYQVNFAGGSTDIAISKFDANGSYLHFSTFLGGSGTEVPHSLVVNENNELYVLGTTSSADFPVTPGAFDSTFNGGDAYVLTSTVRYLTGSDIIVAKFNDSGTALLGSTYVGGTANDGLNTVTTLRKNYADEARGEIIIDEQSNVYIASSTQSIDFPTTTNTFQPVFNGGTQDGCLIKFNHNLTNMIWCSFIGGSGDDAAYSLVLASDNSVYVCGGTTSTNLPTSASAVQTWFAGGANDGYVAHVSANGTQLLQATYLGKSGYDQAYLVKNDRFDNPHLFGQTDATGMAWIANADWYVPNGGQFLTKLTPTLDSVIWSTAFGTGNGGLDISPTALLVDLCNNIYMSGWGSPSTNGGLGGTAGLPITGDAFQSTTDNNDYYFICISDDASQLVYATYFGSPHAREHVDGGTSRFDNKGRIYQAVCAGCGGYDDFPTTQGAWSEQNNSTNCNIGVIKFDFNLPAVVAEFNIPNTVCAPVQLACNNTSQRISDSTSFFWDFGDGTTSTLENPVHTFTQSGTYTITLVAQDVGSCNFADTTTHDITVLSNSNTTLTDAGTCLGDFVQIGIAPSGNANVTYEWSPQTDLSNPFISNPIANPSTSTTYQLFVSDGVCMDTITQHVTVEELTAEAGADQTICLGHSATLTASSEGIGTAYFWSDNAQFSHILNNDIHSPEVTVTPTVNTTYFLRIESSYCESIDSVTVTISNFGLNAPDHFTVCYGDSVHLTITPDETGTYTYQWAPVSEILSGENSDSPCVAPTEDASYAVTVTNEHGCMATADIAVHIKRYNTHAEIDNVQCFNGLDGRISLNVTGGDAPYYYEWSNGANTPDLTQIGAGNYTVFITDNTGCKGVDTFAITQPDSIDIQLINSHNSFCGEPCNGALTVGIVGGTPPYTYTWLHGDSSLSISGLCAGFYTILVEDAHHCAANGTFPVDDTSHFNFNYQLSPISCAGACDGAIYLETDFGGFNYQTDWQHDAALHADSAVQLCAGNYHAHLSVENGCDYHLYIPVENTAELRFLHVYAQPPLCHGENNAALHISVDGGVAPYTYFLNNENSDNDISNLEPGTYSITVTDGHGCRIDTTVTIMETPQLVLGESHFSPPCPEICIGNITALPEGGTLPYHYVWDNGATTPILENLCAGDYNLIITDLHNCSATLSITLTDSTLFTDSIEAWSDLDTVYEGEPVVLHVTDLGADFHYQWSPANETEQPNATTTTARPTSATDFVITVYDEYGCSKTDTLTIKVLDVICEEPYVFVPKAFTPNGDGKNDVLFVRGEVIKEVVFEIFDRWGELLFSTTDLTHGWDGTFRGKPCEPGVYDYYMQVVCLGQKKYFKKGNVTLIR